MKTVLSIAGSDCSGGAGIQADIKTITANGLYAMSVITALTAQNTQAVQAVEVTSPEMVGKQMDSVFTDIFPDAVKIGMVPNSEIAEVIAAKLVEYKVNNIVLDPVMVATSGDRLIEEDAIATISGKLFPLATLITPNIPEAEVLSGQKIQIQEDMMRCAKKLSEDFNVAVLLKGGHLVEEANDYFYFSGQDKFFRAERIETKNTHGTGCTLSSAIACGLAKGKNLEESIADAKIYLTAAIKSGLELGKGCGPVNHVWNINT